MVEIPDLHLVQSYHWPLYIMIVQRFLNVRRLEVGYRVIISLDVAFYLKKDII